MFFSALTKCAIENTKNSTWYTALKINTCHSKNYIAKINIT